MHVLNKEARADYQLIVKITVNWARDNIDPYDIDATAELLNANNEVIATKELIPNPGLTAFSSMFFNFSSTAVRVRFNYNPENLDWQGAEPPVVWDIQWPVLPDMVLDLVPFD